MLLAIAVLSTAIATSYAIYTRRLCNQLRERIAESEETNRRLGDTIGQCKSISNDLGKSVERNIQTARDCIELIEEIRIEVQSLEMVTGDWNSDEYYNKWDSYFGID